MNERGPDIGPWDAAELAAEGPYGDGAWGGFDPDEIQYGMPLEYLLSEFDSFGDFLAATVVAGHVPLPIFEAVRMLLKAHQRWSIAQAQTARAEDVDGDALGWLNANEHRELIILLEEQTAELELRAAAILRSTPSHQAVTPQLRSFWDGLAAAAVSRAERARLRATFVNEDIQEAADPGPAPAA